MHMLKKTIAGSLAALSLFSAGALAGMTFDDVASDAWYKDAVEFVSEKGLMTGQSETLFAPEANVNRAELAIILKRFHDMLEKNSEKEPEQKVVVRPKITNHDLVESAFQALKQNDINLITPYLMDEQMFYQIKEIQDEIQVRGQDVLAKEITEYVASFSKEIKEVFPMFQDIFQELEFDLEQAELKKVYIKENTPDEISTQYTEFSKDDQTSPIDITLCIHSQDNITELKLKNTNIIDGKRFMGGKYHFSSFLPKQDASQDVANVVMKYSLNSYLGPCYADLADSDPDQAKEQEALSKLASCLAEKDVKYYGAFWCPACQEQNSLFGKAAENLPYVECSTEDKIDQLQVCKDKKIMSYPTWVFGEDERLEGVKTPQELADKTDCDYK